MHTQTCTDKALIVDTHFNPLAPFSKLHVSSPAQGYFLKQEWVELSTNEPQTIDTILIHHSYMGGRTKFFKIWEERILYKKKGWKFHLLNSTRIKHNCDERMILFSIPTFSLMEPACSQLRTRVFQIWEGRVVHKRLIPFLPSESILESKRQVWVKIKFWKCSISVPSNFWVCRLLYMKV